MATSTSPRAPVRRNLLRDEIIVYRQAKRMGKDQLLAEFFRSNESAAEWKRRIELGMYAGAPALAEQAAYWRDYDAMSARVLFEELAHRHHLREADQKRLKVYKTMVAGRRPAGKRRGNRRR